MMNYLDFKKLASFVDMLVGAGLPVQYVTLGCFTIISFDSRHMDAGECYELLWSVLDSVDFNVTIQETSRKFPYLVVYDYGTKN